MTDTVRTVSALQTLLADGQADYAITPQIIRDMLVSLAGLNIYDGGYNFYDLQHPSFGAKGDGSTDDITIINSTIVTAAVTGGTVRFQQGKVYAIGGMIQLKSGVTLQGGVGGGSPNDNSRIQAKLPAMAGLTMLNTGNPDNNGQNLIGNAIRNLTFYGAASGTVNASRPLHAITFSKNADTTTNKYDFPCTIEWCSFQRFGGDAIQWNGGATNLHVRASRFDHISGYALNVTCKTGTWLGSVSECTWDTGTETETTPNGFVMLDGQPTLADVTGVSRFSINNCRLEINKALVGNLAVIALGVDPVGSTAVVQHYLKCDTVSFDFGSTAIAGANYVVGLVGTACDNVDIEMVNCYFQFPDSILGYVHGLSSTWLAPNPTSSNKYHPTHWTCRPFMYGSPGSSQSRQIFGEKVEFRASIILGGDGASDANTRNKRGLFAWYTASAVPDTPPTGCLIWYIDPGTGVVKQKDSAGVVKTVTVA